MDAIQFPVIKGSPGWYPNEGPKPRPCPSCGQLMKKQFVGFAGGAVFPDGDQHLLQGFLYVHVHKDSTEMEGSKVLSIVEESNGGQFEFAFCSTKCLAAFFRTVVETLEKQESIGDITDSQSD